MGFRGRQGGMRKRQKIVMVIWYEIVWATNFLLFLLSLFLFSGSALLLWTHTVVGAITNAQHTKTKKKSTIQIAWLLEIFCAGAKSELKIFINCFHVMSWRPCWYNKLFLGKWNYVFLQISFTKSISFDLKLSIALCCKLPFFPLLVFSLWAQDVIHGNFTKVCPQGNFECC